ncbi:YebC/PmpR family DNA-binding transcriptional regulator [bacterium]|jgi:YebC/PmpR family DNA-binding regulatory protein|nr:YebC/PmpR family DNA-binding transcriptional regulator [bacterium]
MSGHSKWSTIKHKKGAKDKARSKVFTKLIRELTTAARNGEPDPGMNPRLRLAIQKSKAANMPNDTIDKAVKRGSGSSDGDDFSEGTYEGYGPGGVGVIVEILTDNKNRTASDVRYIFSKHGGSLGSPGSVSYNFERTGQLIFSRDQGSEEEFMDHVLEAGADDLLLEDENVYEVICSPESFHSVLEYFQSKEMEAEESDVVMRPKTRITLQAADLSGLLKMLNALEENDDVQNVYSSFDASDNDMEKVLSQL